MRVCGQWFDEAVRARITAVVQRTPEINRSALARQVCEWLGWRDARGQPQVGGARKALVELHRRGVIALPPSNRQPRTPKSGSPVPLDPAVQAAQAAVACDLASLGAVTVACIETPAQRAVYRQLMAQHPLGDRPLCGAQLRYLITCSAGYLGAAGFQSGGFALQARDRWIGWGEATRRGNLDRLVANTRYLILPSVSVPHLASHVLGMLVRQLPEDWQARYGVRPLLLETFVHPDYKGTCYKAAGWECVGKTAGRRDGVAKTVWLRALAPRAREALRHGAARLPSERRQRSDNWVENEFGGLPVWDARLKQRLQQVVEEFWSHSQSPPSSDAPVDRAREMGAYRLFRNPKVTLSTLLAAHRQAVIDRIDAHRLVLVPQGATTIHYSDCLLGGKRRAVNVLLHHSQALTACGMPLGVVSAEAWSDDSAVQTTQRRLPCTSQTARNAYAELQALALQAPNTTLVSIADCANDLFDLFALARHPDSPRLLVRAIRRGKQPTIDAAATLALQATQTAGIDAVTRLALQLPRQDGQQSRRAELELRFAPVRIEPPGRTQETPLDLWAVQLIEPHPPANTVSVDWLFLTNVPTTTGEAALERIRWYSARQDIAAFHRALKTGCGIDNRKLSYSAHPEAYLGIDLVMAWRIWHLASQGRTDAEQPIRQQLQGA